MKAGYFWAKYEEKTGASLSLLAHSLDVSLVLRALCEVGGVKRSLRNCTSQGVSGALLDRLAVLAMLHDLGKANLGFQDKIKPTGPRWAGHIQELEPLLCERDLNARLVASLPAQMNTWFRDEASANSYFYAVFSHHGRPVEFRGSRAGNYRLARDVWWRPDSTRDPFQAIAEISLLAPIAFPQAFAPDAAALPCEPRFHHRFAGLVMLADWLGSHSHWFPLEETTAEKRLLHARNTAPHLLRAIGFDSAQLRPRLSAVGSKFASRFNLPPRPLQKVIDDLDPHDKNTRLVVAESETGSGKTEAALNWFAKLFAAKKVDSLYFALPTRVAARELYRRIENTMRCWFPDPQQRPVTLLAVPGYARVDGHPVRRLPPDSPTANQWEDNREIRILERHWAGALSKRFLAATVAVGTIDQALLSAVQTNHAHLRSVCLDRSLLVVDEVHASDIYMSRLLQSLLQHHLGAGGSALLLSATLGAGSLYRYIQITEPAAVLPSLETAVARPYPCLTLANGEVVRTTSKADFRKRVRFQILPASFQPQTIIQPLLIPALKAGARVLVIMNTVARAVALLKAVEEHPGVDPNWLFRCGGQVCPHHGRFAPPDRALLDEAVSAGLGQEGAAGPLLLIGTQTLEQSLDIDADLLVTDLAPCDVLLQRIGRLHRHKRDRPVGLERAQCAILVPDGDLESALTVEGQVRPEFLRIGFGSVYEDLRSLELTLRTLRERSLVVIPDENRFLVEQTTHPNALESLRGPSWKEHYLRVVGEEIAKRVAADIVADPFGESFKKIKFVDSGLAVATRLGENLFRAPLSQTVLSPFGLELTEIFIPGHLAPKNWREDAVLQVEVGKGVVNLRYENQRYRYSKYGLEGIP